MTLNTVTLTWDLTDLIESGVSAVITLVPTAVLTDTTDHITIGQVSRSVHFGGGTGQLAGIVATDNASISPAGWAYTITITTVQGQQVYSQTAFINFANGSVQDLSTLPVAQNATVLTAQIPVGTIHLAAAPTGATATDTPNLQAAITALTASGGGTLLLQAGTYQADSNALVIRSCSNFTVRGTGATVIAQAPNRAGLPNNTTGDLFVIADSTDFRVEGITFDGLRDTRSPLTPLSASASSGQPSVTVAAGQGTRYVQGQFLALFGGLGSSDQALFEGWGNGGAHTPLTISSITAGGGSGGGDLITFTANLANTYTQISSTAFTDGYGPYAYAGAYLTPYQVGNNTVAGRTMGGEDQQCGLHLLSCQRFVIDRVVARNVWESPIKLGTGFSATSLTDGCQQGTVTNCVMTHGYDQGVSAWVCQNITVTGCLANAAGWAGICLTASDYCTVVANQCLNSVYRVPLNNNAGSGIVTEGGVRNQVKGNIILAPYAEGIQTKDSPLYWGLSNSTFPTTSAWLSTGTAAGTSIQLSATSALIQNGLYSILDGPRTEAVKVASIVDGTHVTFDSALRFSHAAGSYIIRRIAEENVIEGNTIRNPGRNGMLASPSVRDTVKENVISGWGANAAGSMHGISFLFITQGLPAGTSLGGDAVHCEGNVVGGSSTSSGGGGGIQVNGASNALIRGNRIFGAANSWPDIELKGVIGGVVEGNHCSENGSSNGIAFDAGGLSGSVQCQYLTVTGNIVQRTFLEGIKVLLGDGFTITGNIVQSCGGNAGIDLLGVTNSAVTGNVCKSNRNVGIKLEDSGGSFCQWNRITGNTTRDDGTGINVNNGTAWTQQHGIVETGTSNSNLFTGNESDGNALDQLTTVGAATVVLANTVSGTLSGFNTAADLQPAGAQAAGATGRITDAAHVHPAMFGGYDMAGSVIIGQTMPFAAAGTTYQPTGAQAGLLLMFRLLIPVAGTTTGWNMFVVTAGNTLANVYCALVNQSGTIVAQTANRAADGALTSSAANWQPPWSSSYAAPAGYYYGCLLIGSATTMPTFAAGRSSSGTMTNLGRTAGSVNLLAATFSSGLSSLPGSVTTASMAGVSGLPWIGLT